MPSSLRRRYASFPRRSRRLPDAARRQAEEPKTGLRFGLHIGSFTFPGGTIATREALRQIAVSAEPAGFDAIYVMDHFRQIPQIGRQWEDFLESYTTLAYLAACTERVRLGDAGQRASRIGTWPISAR